MIGKAIVFFFYTLTAMFGLSVLSRFAELGVGFNGELGVQALVLAGLSLAFMFVYALISASVAALFHLRTLGRLAEIAISTFAAIAVLVAMSSIVPAYISLAGMNAAIIGGVISSAIVLSLGTISHPFAYFQTLLPVRIIDEN